MGIRREHGQVSSIAKLAKLSGQAKQAGREQALKAQALARAEQMAQQERMAQFQAQLTEQLDYRALQFEAEKIEARSMHTFQMEEMEREAFRQRELAKTLKKQEEHDLAVDLINKDQSISDDERDETLRRVELQYLGYGVAAPKQYAPQQDTTKKEDPFTSLIEAVRSGGMPVATTSTNKEYSMGQVIERGGKSYKIVGFDKDGMPLVDEVK